MNPPVASTAEPVLLFNWTPSRRRKLALGSFLLGSLVLHALGFYAFQIIYPPAVSLLPPPGRVSIIGPASEQGRLLLRWVEAEDPALALTTQRPPEAKGFQPPKVPHVASYLTHEPELRKPPPYAPALNVPDIQPPGPVFRPRTKPAAAKAGRSKTAIELSDDTRDLTVAQMAEMKFTRSNTDAPQTAVFRVAIAISGEVRYCFLQTSSGDAALDEQAGHSIALCRFAARQNSAGAPDLIWTTAAVAWGNDLAAPDSAPATTPKP